MYQLLTNWKQEKNKQQNLENYFIIYLDFI